MRGAVREAEAGARPAADAPPLERLRRLHVEVTNRCNSRCATCVRTSAPEPPRDLRAREVAAIADLPALASVALQVNGEPLLNRELEAIVRLLSRRGVRVELNTNGVGLDARRRRALLASGLAELNVSLDAATPGTYRLLRGVDALERVVRNAAAFARARGAADRPALWAWVTLGRHNVEELPALVELAARTGFDGLYLQRLVYFGRGLARAEDSLHGRLSAAQEACLDRAVERAARLGLRLAASGGHPPRAMLSSRPEPARGCRRPGGSAVVMADGDVVPCCISTFVAPRAAITMGNVLASGWAEVWSSAAYARFRADLRRGELPACCRRCGVEWSL